MSQAAPGALETVRRFVNTVDLEAGQDEIDAPERLRDWLAAAGLLPAAASVDETGWRQAIALREGLRSLLLANAGAPVDPAALAVVNEIAAGATLAVQVEPDGRAVLAPAAPGVAGALGHLLGLVYTAVADGSWPRLKVCRSDTCRWAFYDHSRNRSGSWCSMSVCGSRSKARAYRRRRRDTDTA